MKNQKSKIKNQNLRARFLFLFMVLAAYGLISLWAHSALAHSDPDVFWTIGDPLVPCGIEPGTKGLPNDSYTAPCNQCQILHLTRHIIDLILLTLMPLIGTLFFIIAGLFMILGGADTGLINQGKTMFKNTVIGIIIVMLAWLLTNTIIHSIANTTSPPSLTIGGVKIESDSTGAWYQFTCTPVN